MGEWCNLKYGLGRTNRRLLHLLSQEAMRPLSRKTAVAIGKEETDGRGLCEGESMGLGAWLHVSFSHFLFDLHSFPLLIIKCMLPLVLSCCSCVWLCVTLWTAAPPGSSVGFSRQEYWSGLPCPLSGNLPDPGLKPRVSCIAGRFFIAEPPGKPYVYKVSLISWFNISWKISHQC